MISEDNENNERCFIVCGVKFVVSSRYSLIRPVGSGAYGVVCSAKDLTTGQNVAIKKISRVFNNLVEAKRTLRELKLLRQFNHDNIIQIRDVIKPHCFDSFEHVYIISELMDSDLHQIINSPQPLSHEHIQYFIYQTLRGLKYIHSAGVLHRDLKPGNILVNSNCDLRICDFGLSRVVRQDIDHKGFMTEYVATRWYRAPEIMLSWTEYTNAVDVWSVGCIMAELILRKPLFAGRDYMHQLHLILDILGTPSYEDTEFIASDKAKRYVRAQPFKLGLSFEQLLPGCDQNCIDFLRGLLEFAPHKRMTVDQALTHPYLAILHDPNDEPIHSGHIDFSFEEGTLTPEGLKQLLFEEIMTPRT